MLSTLKAGFLELENTNVNFLAIACNTAHVYFSDLEKLVRKPLLNMVDLSVAALPEQLKRVAVIASRVTIDSQIYQKRLTQAGFKVIAPDWQADIDHLISINRKETDKETIKRQCQLLVRKAVQYEADGILLACLDLSIIRKAFEAELHVVDASEELAKNVISNWLKLQTTR